MSTADYSQRLLSAVRANWADLRLVYFNSCHPKVAAAWRQVEAEVGKASAAVPPRAHFSQLIAGLRRPSSMAVKVAVAEFQSEIKKAAKKREEEELEFALRVLELRRSQNLSRMKCIELAAKELKETNEFVHINFDEKIPKKMFLKLQSAVRATQPTSKVTRAVLVYLHLFGKQHPTDQHRGPTNDHLTVRFLRALGVKKERTPVNTTPTRTPSATIVSTPQASHHALSEELSTPRASVKRELPSEDSFSAPLPAKRSCLDESNRCETPQTTSSLPSLPFSPVVSDAVSLAVEMPTPRRILTSIKAEPTEQKELEIEVIMQKIAGAEDEPETTVAAVNVFDDLLRDFEEREIFGDLYQQVRAAKNIIKTAGHIADLQKAARLLSFVYSEITSKPRRQLDRGLEILNNIRQTFPSLN